MKHFLTTFFLLAFISALGAENPLPCGPWTIHGIGSGRKFLGQDDMGGYSYMLANQPIVGVRGPIAAFPDVTEFTIGNKAIGDLGAGRSDIIPTMLKARKAEGLELSNLHAIDHDYPSQPGEPINSRVIEMTDTLRTYPRNFHGQLFQQLDLVYGGKRILFDELLSSSSLSYVLKKASVPECEFILDRIVDHLQPGGRLRIWQDGEGELALTIDKLKPYLQARIASGTISNYSLPMEGFDIFVLVK